GQTAVFKVIVVAVATAPAGTSVSDVATGGGVTLDENLGNNSATATTVIYEPPVASNDSYSTISDAGVTASAPAGGVGHDTDPQGAAMTATLVSGPAHGTLTLNSDGSFTYTQTSGWTGTDTFVYRVSDAAGAGNSATVTLTVSDAALTATGQTVSATEAAS